MEAYCERQGKQLSSIKFVLDGKKLLPTMTAEEVIFLFIKAGIENDDIIDANLQQEGGKFFITHF